MQVHTFNMHLSVKKPICDNIFKKLVSVRVCPSKTSKKHAKNYYGGLGAVPGYKFIVTG